MLASLPLIQDTKLSVYLLVGWLSVYVVSTHAPIFIFPSIPINVLTHSTESAFIFTSVKSIIYSLYLCELFLGVLLSPQMGTSEAQLTPVARHRTPDVNPSTRVSLCVIFRTAHSAFLILCFWGALGLCCCPSLVLFHTYFLFISSHNWLRCLERELQDVLSSFTSNWPKLRTNYSKEH